MFQSFPFALHEMGAIDVLCRTCKSMWLALIYIMYKVVLAGKVASSNQVAWHLKQKKQQQKKKRMKN